MPAARFRKSETPESVPEHGDPERKRVLNVLAQRRYRQRRREKMAALEAQAKSLSPPLELDVTQVSTQGPDPNHPSQVLSRPLFEELGAVEEVIRTNEAPEPFTLDFDQDPSAFDRTLMHDFNIFTNLPTPLTSTSSPSPFNFPLTPDSALLSIPILSAARAFTHIAIALDVATHLWDPFYLHVLPSSIPALATLPKNLHPVSAQLTVPHHPLLDILPWPSVREKLICMLSMPSAFRPPVAREEDSSDPFTFLPAAGVQGKNSCTWAKQSTAIVQLVQDIDDFQDGGGIRVHGNMTTWSEGNELVEEAWEIGEVFYRKWWWCCDQAVVEASNRKRRERGLGKLRITA